MKADFDIKSYSLESFVCALLLMLASFSVLPFSVAIVESQNDSATELIQVFARNEKQENSDNKKQSVSSYANKNLSFDSHQKVSPSVNVPTLDFSSLDVGLPNFSGSADFQITSFGVGTSEFVSNEIVVFELSGLDRIPKRLNNVRIKYPPDMLRRGIEGEVRLNVVIDESGNLEVESVASSTNSRFESSAIASAINLKYEVPMRAGKPVRARFVLPIPFKILK